MSSDNRDIGSVRAFERLVKSFEPDMLRAVWRVTRNRNLAEDALQNTLLTIWKKLAQVTSHPHPRALVLRICIDEAWSIRRRQFREPKQFNELEQLDQQSVPIASSGFDPYAILVERESLKQLFDAMQALPEQQANCIWLRCVEQLTYSEIAVVAECSEATARKHVERGREKLRKVVPIPGSSFTKATNQ